MKFENHRTNAQSAPGRRPTDAGFSLTAALAWGLMFPIAAGVMDHVDAVNLTALRYAGASVLFLALLWAVEGRDALRYEGRFLRLWFLGSLGFAGFNLLAYLALNYTEPQNAALIVSTAPLVTVALRWALDGVRPAPAVVGFAVLALVGVATVLGKGDPTGLVANANIGDLLVFGGVIGWVLYTMGAAHHAELSPLRYTALTAPAGLITILGITVVTDLAGWTSLPSVGDVSTEWLGILYVIIFGALVAVLSWNEGVRRLGPSNGALFMNLVPITTFAVAIAQGYDPSTGEIGGAALTVAAIVAANRAAVRAAARAAAGDERAPALRPAASGA